MEKLLRDCRPSLSWKRLHSPWRSRFVELLLDPGIQLEAWVSSIAHSTVYQVHGWFVSYGCSSKSTVIHIMVTSIKHCNVLCVGLPPKMAQKLQLVQTAVAKLLPGTGYRVCITSVLKGLHCLPICFRGFILSTFASVLRIVVSNSSFLILWVLIVSNLE